MTALVGDYLRREGFAVVEVHDGAAAVVAAGETDPDVIVLDIGLPQMDGIEVCREVRRFSDCYVIMLTARVDEVDKLVGLSIGADDYVTKPFSPRELVARVKALLRRPRTARASEGAQDLAPPTSVTFGDLAIAAASREARLAGDVVPLTRTEFDILATLARRPFHVFSRRSLIAAVWGDDWVADEHLVDVHILHLRQKLGDDAKRQQYIQTYRGVGYRMGSGAP